MDRALVAADVLLQNGDEETRHQTHAKLRDLKALWEETTTYIIHCHRYSRGPTLSPVTGTAGIHCHRYSRGPTLSQVQQGVCLEWLKNLQIFYRTVSIREVFVF